MVKSIYLQDRMARNVAVTSAPDVTTDEWLTPVEVASEWKLSPQTLANLRYQRKGPPYRKLGDGKFAPVRYRRSAVEAWMSAPVGSGGGA